jgi:primosomal protein N' (replication factor Y)
MLDKPRQISVLVQTPAHSSLTEPLDYESLQPLSPGSLVRVPLGKRETLGLVWPRSSTEEDRSGIALRPVSEVLHSIPPLNAAWMQFIQFAAGYYQRSLGELALSVLPPQLKKLDQSQIAKKLDRINKQAHASGKASGSDQPTLTDEQSTCLQTLRLAENSNRCHLLFGSTGSGKTEVYLQRIADVLRQSETAQVLIMVPEINLTPQLQERVLDRFKDQYGTDCMVCMHSSMTPAQRLQAWLKAHNRVARIVLGTRMAVFASMPGLQLIVVDEEHDPSYKQQEGARYSARDLAVYRGHQDGIQVILGSATPSLESWHLSRPGGRYIRLHMPARIGSVDMPRMKLVDMRLQPRGTLFANSSLEALRNHLAHQQQVMILLNRRGYAPVLNCMDCGWKSNCQQCSAFQVFHKVDRTLRCHHCGQTRRAPRQCPSCGNIDIGMLGRGTEQIEERLAELLEDMRRPDGSALEILRIDADSTRAKGSLESQLEQVHAGEIDVLIGTQMIAKGHDFKRMSMVLVIDPDGALFSSDFRAPERLFSLLMQAAGRAGRQSAHKACMPAEVWIQTAHPEHALYASLIAHDYPQFANQQLAQRLEAGMPPFMAQALVRAEAKSLAMAQAFLESAKQAGMTWLQSHHEMLHQHQVTLYPAIPMSLQKLANLERAQMLIECPSRQALQLFLHEWQPMLRRVHGEHRQVLRWAIDIDPLAI